MVKEKVYSGRHAKPFESKNEFKERIGPVLDQCAANIKRLRKSIKHFSLRL